MRLLIALALLCAAFPAAASAEQTSRFEFVKEYVRQLGAIDKARDLAALDESAPSPPRISGPVRGRARIVAALSNQIQILRGMRLPEPFERLADNIADFYQRKVDLYHSMKDDVVKASTLAAADDSGRAAIATDSAAAIEGVDRSLLESTPIIFAVLVDRTKPDETGRMTRLLITTKERDLLLRALDTSFGNKLNQQNRSLLVNTAALLKFYLLRKEYKCADEL